MAPVSNFLLWQTMVDRTLAGKKQEYLKNLRFINQRAEVEPEIVDLIEAYARLRLEQDNELLFYGNKITAKNRDLNEFIDKNRHLDPRTLNFLASYFLEMKKRGLKCIFDSSHLAHFLKLSTKKMNWLANDKVDHYLSFHEKKRGGGVREIFAPKSSLKGVQRKILDLLLQSVPLNSHAEGFRRKRSIVTNAKRHIDKKVVIKIDAKDFFPSITFKRVLGMFVSLGYTRNVSLMLAKLTTHQGRLPTGAPTSPAISNIISRRLDKRLARLGEKMGFDYSRYADDMTISSNNKDASRMIPFFKEIIREEGFEINEAKMRILRSGGRQKITGIVVNQKMNVGRKEIRKLRAVIYNCRHKGIKQEMIKWAKKEKNLNNPYGYTLREFRASLLGKINFVKSVNADAGKKLLKQFDELSLKT